MLFEQQQITCELHYEEFEAVLNQSTHLPDFAASRVHAAYAAVGASLSVQGVVLFQVYVDEQGYADPGFNLPLRYLLRNAGSGPDLGRGAIKLACRGQCSVPWHSKNLWHPEAEGEQHPAMLVQKAVWRNRLGLPLINAPCSAEPDALVASGGGTIASGFAAAELAEHADATCGTQIDDIIASDGRVNVRQLIEQHHKSVRELERKHQDALVQQQQIHLEQIRRTREELRQARGALEHERYRNRMLQQLLRGDG